MNMKVDSLHPTEVSPDNSVNPQLRAPLHANSEKRPRHRY